MIAELKFHKLINFSVQNYPVIFKKICLLFVLFAFLDGYSQNRPNQINGLQLWLRADSNITYNGSNVSSWNDCSGNGYSITQNSNANQPTVVHNVSNLNNQSVIRFDGSDDFLDGGITIGNLTSNGATVFIIAKNNVSQGTYFAKSLYGGAPDRYALEYDPQWNGGFAFFYLAGGQDGSIRTSSHVFGNYELITTNTDYTKAINSLYINSILTGTTPISNTNLLTNSYDFLIGALNSGSGGIPPTSGYFLNGDLAEIILYNRALSDNERVSIENYLLKKYTKTINLGSNFIVNNSFCDTTIHAGMGFISYKWSTGATSESITVGKGTYSVTGTNAFGFVSSDTISISYKYATLKDTTICKGETIVLDPNLDPLFIYNWSTGQTTPTITITSVGKYWVSVSDSKGCSIKSDTITITEDLFPMVASLGADTSICSGNSIGLQKNIPLTGVTYQWSTKETTPNISITNNGTYYVTATNANNCIAKDTIYITVKGTAPNPNFTVPSACLGTPVLFSDLSTQSDSWLWNFGDGTSSTYQNPTHKYAQSGTYDITLKVKSGTCENQISKQIAIPQKPDVPILVSPASNYIATDSVITFKWTTSSNADYSVIEIGSNASLSSLLYTSDHLTEDSVQYTISSPYNDIYWRVTSYNSCGNIVSVINKVSFFFTATIPGLNVWFNADKLMVGNNNPVATWTSSNDALKKITQTTTANQPVLKTNVLNGHAVVRFDGANDYFDGGTSLGNIQSTGASIFIVGKSNIAQGSYLSKAVYGDANSRYAIQYDPTWNGGFVFFYLDNANRTIKGAAHDYGNYDLISTIVDVPNSKAEMFVYGTSLGTSTISSTYSMESSYNFLVGAYNGSSGGIPPTSAYYLNGDIAEILFFDRALTSSERKTVEDYLHKKYCPTLNLGPDINITKSLCDTTIHAGKGFKSYLWSTGDTTESITVNKSGKYLVDVTDIFDYKSSDDINVYFGILPNVIRDTTICPATAINWDTKLNTTDFSYKWNTGATTPAISISSAGHYTVTIYDKSGCSYKSDTVTVSIDDFNTAINLGNDTTLCKYNEIALKKGNNRCVSYLWDDGSTYKALPVLSSGIYSITATDAYGCKASDRIGITISGIAPDTKFSFIGHCQNEPISFTNNSVSRDASTITSWIWFMGKDTLKGKDVSYQYGNQGTFYITLKTYTDGACSGEKTLPITIDPTPVVSFKPVSVCQYSKNTFINTSTINSGKMVHFAWTFNDSLISDIDSISLSFATAGTVGSKLLVTSDKNCSDSVIVPLEIKSSPKAIIGNSASCNKGIYYLFDESTIPTSNSLMERIWYINSYPVSYAQTLNYKPDTTREYDLTKLYVKGVNGCIDTASKKIIFSPKPIAAMKFEKACVGDSARFYDKSTVTTGSIVKWKWNIGDNETFEQNPVLVFTKSKSYPVSLHVTSDMGCEDTIVSTIKTIEKPVAHFDFGPKIVGAPVDITFTNSSDSATSYLWNFGDLSTSTEFEPVHEYLDSGKYIITLNAYNDYLCADSSKQTFVLPWSNYKIIQTNIQITEKNGYVAVSTIFINAGLNPFTTIDFILTKDDGTWVKETWTGLLTTGIVDTFTFASHFRELDGVLPKYICIDANVLDKHDSTVATDNLCLTQSQDFTCYAVYPNPADKKITITLATPEKGLIDYTIYDNTGRSAIVGSRSVEEGFNAITIPTSDLSQGYYIWKVGLNGKSKTGSFIINRMTK